MKTENAHPFIVSTAGWFGGAVYVVYAKNEKDAQAKARSLSEADDEIKVYDILSLNENEITKIHTWSR